MSDRDDIMKYFKSFREQTYDAEAKQDGRFTDLHKQSTDGINSSEDGICELSTDLDKRLADIENAICDLTAAKEESK